MAQSQRSSYDSWMAEVQKRAQKKAEEEATYDTARAGEQSALDAWNVHSAGLPGRQAAYAQQWGAGEADRKRRFEELQDLRYNQEKEQRLSAQAVPGHHWGYTNRMVAQDLANPQQAWKYTHRSDPFQLRRGYERAMAAPYAPRETYVGQTMPAYSEEGTAAPTVRAARVAAQPRTIGAGNAGDLNVAMTERYGKNFLAPWSRDVLGFDPQMTALQKLLGQTDDLYGLGDLPTGTQAYRDFGASNLWDFLDQQRESGDISALDESKNLQAFIKGRLGLQSSNIDDLLAGLGKHYRHVRQ